ncbi:helix-turn-helix domain-containing protein [Phototrophicus methaneseepsis]|uniref:Helix-turn-helix domain-containing protein n=1 Tax=Phototrophicus methaneseepsis TaxID=2710758 RepID=A0A7S8EB51_9CHLR|nr:AraC family transcriptional regulator [Phototrophicus methaneseepsis]QPC83721.1 helix-turn-helix domain-containing protein [Phototrophicus methaneseepsis]
MSYMAMGQSSEVTFPIHRRDLTNHEYAFALRKFCPNNPIEQPKYPHRHAFYQMLYITGGQGNHVVDFEPFPLNPPVLYFLSPQQVHFWELNAPLQGYSLTFGSDFLVFNAVESTTAVNPLSLFYNFPYKPLHVKPKQAESLKQTIDLIAQEYDAREPNYVSIVRAYLHVLFSKIQRLSNVMEPDANASSLEELIYRFRKLVSLHYRDQRSVDFYADQLGISPSYLSERVKAFTGCTVGQIIRYRVLLEAKRLLINTDLTIEQICYRLDFSDPAYFGRFFKRETSTSPGKYRQNTREKYQISQV